MAHHVEPMDIDSDFDNKENSLHHNNVLPFTEKGYEELDVSELNMKLRYSVTPASSPMSKSFTANCTDNRSLESGDDSLNVTVNENFTLTNSLNSTLTKNDNIIKSLKSFPLQAIPTEQFVDSNRNATVLRSLDSAVTADNGNITVTVSGPSDIDENLSLPSSSSSALHTPEATTPTKDIPIKDGGSPIMRGLKSVLNMFRSSQSPIPPLDNESITKQEILSPAEVPLPVQDQSQAVLASTPIAAHRKKEMSPTKRSSPQKESSVIFNDDLEKELQWKDETTIIFSQERIPIHKLMLQQPQDSKNLCKDITSSVKQDIQDLNSTVEYMDISYNDSFRDRTITEIQVDNAKIDGTFGGESDSEFVDCETTFTKNKSPTFDDNDRTPKANQTQDLDLTNKIENKNDSGSRLKQIILDTTQDILDATLSVRPEDLLPEILDQTKNVPEPLLNKTETIALNETTIKDIQEESSSSQHLQPILNQTVDISNPIVLEAKGKEENLNATKTIEEAITTQPINQTFDVASSSINEGDKIENIDVSKVIENVLGVTHILVSNETKELDCTKTIEETTTTQPINETFNVTNSLINEENQNENLNVTKTDENVLGVTQILENNDSKDLNCTKTIEEATITQTNNQTFDVTISLLHEENHKEILNITNTLENVLGVTQTLDNNESKELNSTKTIEVNTTEAINLTFDTAGALITEEIQKENLDVTETAGNILGVTQILDSHNISENLDTQISNVTAVPENKNSNTTIISISDNITSTTNELSLANQPSDSVVSTEIPIQPIVDPVLVEEAGIKPLPIPDDIDISVQDVTMTELPVDIPLPDEDDLEKELNLPIETPSEECPPVSLPLDLVDDIKTTKINEVSTAIDQNEVKLTENTNNEVILPEVCALLSTSKLEGADHVDHNVIENNITEPVKNYLDTVEKMNIENEMSELCKEIENTNLLPEVAAVSNIATNDDVGEVDKEIEKSKIDETNIEINMVETVNIDKTVEQLNQDVDHASDVPTVNNENVSELKPLPDIINQTIAVSNTENLNNSLNVTETMLPEKVESIEESNVNTVTVPDTTTLDIKEAEQQISSTTDIENLNPKMETDTQIQEEPFVTSSGHASVIQDSVTDVADISMSEPMTDVSDIKKVDVVPADNLSAICDAPANIETAEQGTEQSSAKEVDEEIVLSENNSPFVSVIADTKTQINTEGENVEDPFATRTKVVITPPSSPPIRSKGYNFNFDDLDFDPFATKTNIRMSPPLDSPNKQANLNTQENVFEKTVPKKDINRRKSQPERRKPTAASKRKFNATFDAKITESKVIEKPVQKLDTELIRDIQLDSPATIALSPNSVTIDEEGDKKAELPPETINAVETEVLVQEKIEKSIEISTDASVNSLESNLNELKPTSSSSDQSTYFSACTTSSESSIPSRNVFNLPEIDDANFNPFATKSKMRQSPPPDIDNPFATRSKIMSSPDSSMIKTQKSEPESISSDDKIETELMEKDVSANLSDSSKATDERNVTTKEIHTEDEDTVEGPFLDSEDLNPDEKITDFDSEKVDMMQFSELPPQSNEDNLDNGEMFIDAEAFEFLLNQNKSNTVADSGKESLFLKFDPLFAKRISAVSSDGVLASLAKFQKRQSTPTKTVRTPPKNMPSPVAGPSNLNVTQDLEMNISEELNDDLNITVSKPMMVVPPAVNPVVTPRNKSLTPNRSNRRSITFTSPAMAVIDRLLSLSANNSLVHDTTVTQVSREQNEADIALTQLRELLAEKEISVYNLKCESNELRDRLNTLEGHVKSLEAESGDRLKKINQLTDTLVEKTKINKSMAAVVEEYERTIASLIAETAQDKKKHAEERMKLINERDEQTAHLASMEVSFSDLHSKYEKSKQVILNCKANEDVYRKSIKEFEENLAKMHNNYELLKQHATSKLNHANQELEKINRSHEAEVLKLNAMIKRKELHITSLEESLAQKTKANDELTAICDELINKVG